MRKFKAGEVLANAFPKAEHPETSFFHLSIVEQYDCSRREFRNPSLKVVLYVVVEMATIDVEQVNGIISEIVDRIVETQADKLGKAGIVRLMIATDIIEYFFAVESLMLVAPPGIDRKTFGVDADALNFLTEAEIRKPQK